MKKEEKEALRARILDALPKKPTEELRAWVLQKNFLSKNVIIFKRGWVRNAITGIKEQAAECRCSACGDHFFTTWISAGCARGGFGFYNYTYNEQVENGSATCCPECGEKVIAIHARNLREDGAIEAVIVGEAAKIEACPVLMFWRLEKCVDKETAAVSYEAGPFEAYAFAERACFRFCGWYKYFSSVTYLPAWETRARATDEVGLMEPRYVRPMQKGIWDGTSMENAKLAEYLAAGTKDRCYPVTYLRTFQQHPQAENLIVQGGARMLNDIIYANSLRSYYYCAYKIPREGIDWKQKTPSGMLGLTRPEYRKMIAEHWTLDDLELFRLGKKCGVDASRARMRSVGLDHFDTKSILERGQDPARAVSYLKKQNGHKDRVKMTVHDLLDYWRMCDANRLEMTGERRWPQNLNRAHDQLLQLNNAKRIDARRKNRLASYGDACKIEAPGFRRLAQIYAGFSFSTPALCIRIAADPMELIEEGAQLNHCVASCISTHAKGERCIFFVRKTEAPDMPYYTLELNMRDLRVIRDLGFENHAKTPQVREFEALWLEHLRQLTAQQKGA